MNWRSRPTAVSDSRLAINLMPESTAKALGRVRLYLRAMTEDTDVLGHEISEFMGIGGGLRMLRA
jgi:hypothetical protein